MAAARPSGRLRVAVACSPVPGAAVEVELWLAPGATARDALRSSGLPEAVAAASIEAPPIGVWGRPCAPETRLRDGDRVELYRPLAMDPKEARRLRAARRPKPAR